MGHDSVYRSKIWNTQLYTYQIYMIIKSTLGAYIRYIPFAKNYGRFLFMNFDKFILQHPYSDI